MLASVPNFVIVISAPKNCDPKRTKSSRWRHHISPSTLVRHERNFSNFLTTGCTISNRLLTKCFLISRLSLYTKQTWWKCHYYTTENMPIFFIIYTRYKNANILRQGFAKANVCKALARPATKCRYESWEWAPALGYCATFSTESPIFWLYSNEPSFLIPLSSHQFNTSKLYIIII